MSITPMDAWALRRRLTGQTLAGHAAALSPRFRELAESLDDAAVEDRRGVMDGWLSGRADANEIIRALAAADPSGPAPTDDRPTPNPAVPQVDDDSAAAWPPLMIAEPPASAPFPVNVFPVALRDYCQEVATTSLAPVDFVGASMLTVAGAASGQSANIELKRTWVEPPELYVVLVALPGSTKSPMIRQVRMPLAKIDERLRKESSEAKQRWEEARKAHAKEPESRPPPGPEPPLRRAIVKDITRESLVGVLRDNPRGVLCDPDEASAWVGSFNQYKAKGTDRQFWLSIWACESISVDRKGVKGAIESTFVPHPFASVLGGIPPAKLASLNGDHGHDEGDGMMDRIVFVYPDESAYPPQRWVEAEMSEATEQPWTDAIARLHATEMQWDQESGRPRPHRVRFTAEAKQAWVDWFDSHAAEMESPDFDGRFRGAWSKLRAHTARFALILSRLRWACDPTAGLSSPGPIELEDVRGAVALANYFKSHLPRVYHQATGGIGSAAGKAILDWIKRHRRSAFRAADVSEHLRWLRESPTALESGLKDLVSAGAIRPSRQCRPKGPGRTSSPAYEVHPDLLGDAPANSGNSANPENIPVPAAPGSISGIRGIPGRVPGDPVHHAAGNAVDRESGEAA